jgi:hypothetical protein
MKSKFRIVFLAAALIAPAGFSIGAAGSGADAQHASQFEAKVSFRDGTTRTVRLQGVGCTQSICSRSVIKGEDGAHKLVSSPFDSLAKIKDTTPDTALFVSNDGTERRLSLVKDFHVLYLQTQSGGTERLDLKSVTSVEFAPANRPYSPPGADRR